MDDGTMSLEIYGAETTWNLTKYQFSKKKEEEYEKEKEEEEEGKGLLDCPHCNNDREWE